MGSRRGKNRKFMLQEQEEDNELFFALVTAIYSSLYEAKRLVHTSSLPGARLAKQILEGHESWSRVEFRMEPGIFRSISNYLRREHLLEGTPRYGGQTQHSLFCSSYRGQG